MKFFKRFQDLGIEGEKAKYYDQLTRVHRIDEMREQATEVARHTKDGDSVLEIAPGAGYLSIELSKLGNYTITGMDISKDLVEICINNAREAGVAIDFQQGNVSEMPFSAEMFKRSGSYSRNEFEAFISQTEFKSYKIRDSAMGFSIYLTR